jgi:hypothetical protein
MRVITTSADQPFPDGVNPCSETQCPRSVDDYSVKPLARLPGLYTFYATFVFDMPVFKATLHVGAVSIPAGLTRVSARSAKNGANRPQHPFGKGLARDLRS